MHNFFKKITSFILIIISTFVLTSCKVTFSFENFELPDNKEGWIVDENIKIEEIEFKDPDLPSISIEEIGFNVKEEDLLGEIEVGKVNDIKSLIYSAITMELEEVGFSVHPGVASSIENDNYHAFGLYYYENNYRLFDSRKLSSVGFIEIADANEVFYAPSNEESLIVVVDTEKGFDSEIVNLVSYTYNELSSYHFVFQNKYVTYYQQDGMKLVYNIHENDPNNYNLEFGNLYDYDNKTYIYDESIFGEYKNHSATELITEVDYQQLEKELKLFQEEQLKNGYLVEEYKVVYISPESIEAYLNSDEEETFFGFNVDELTKTLGLGKALEYTNHGFVLADYIEENNPYYNWKSFLTKIGIGAGITIVGAALTPLTGGASFACSLMFITKFAVSKAFIAAIVPMAVTAATSLINGKSIVETLQKSVYAGLDGFANGFVIAATIGSVGSVFNIIKPNACFVEGTDVLVDIVDGKNVYKPINEIKVGDYVLSYSETSKEVSKQIVTETFINKAKELVTINVNGTIIKATTNHPFYSVTRNGWVEAKDLLVGETLLDSNKKIQHVQSITIETLKEEINVFNFTVNKNHNYFVGESNILVHNDCNTLQSKRNKAVYEAWKKEREAVINGTSKYNWSSEEMKQIIEYGKVKGYGINGAHIVDVSALKDTAFDSLISDPDNIVFLSKEQHLAVHGGSWKNPTNPDLIVKFLPWAQEQVARILGMIQ